MGKLFALVTGSLFLLASIFGFAVIGCYPLMLLWNWLMPELFSLKMIDIWQALGILILSGILFNRGSKSS